MDNTNVDGVGEDVEEKESEHKINIDTNEKKLIVQKDETFEELADNEVIATEMKDKTNWNKTVNSSTLGKDTVINIGVSETSAIAYHIGRKKPRIWPFHNRSIFRKFLRQDNQQKDQTGSQRFSRQRFIVMFQEFAYGGSPDGPHLDYDPETRNSFVLLVMIIVFVMLLFTTAFVAVVLSSPDLKDFFIEYRTFIFVAATIGQLICTYMIMCSLCARRLPCNIVVLVLATLSMSVLAALITAYFRTEIILYAAISTAAIVLVCAGLALTSFDFTKWLLYVIVIGVAFSVLTIGAFIGMRVTGHYMKPVHLGILVVSVLIQSVVLVIQLQLILGGKSVELAEDDYALGAFMLYTSIVDLFLKMVQILGLLDE